MDNINHTHTKDFTFCLDSFGLQQHVDVPTHTKGHTLDLVCCTGVTPINCSAFDLPPEITDHKLVTFDLHLPLSKTKLSRVMSFRNIRNIHLDNLTAGIDSLPIITPPCNPDQLVSIYNDGLQPLLNSLAPL